ncbi:hypothetical protein ACP70R_024143 [Stipagrostis hirtigluma subsp. patula]
MAPVVLQMNVHCLSCARKIRKAIKNLYGVEDVWASPETGLVVVDGWADAAALKCRLQSKMRRPVAIVNDGAEEDDAWRTARYPHAPAPQGYPPYARMEHLGPAPAYPYHHGGWRGDHRYAPEDDGFFHHRRRYAWNDDGLYSRRQYMPNDAPVCFSDENPNCCAVQ